MIGKVFQQIKQWIKGRKMVKRERHSNGDGETGINIKRVNVVVPMAA